MDGTKAELAQNKSKLEWFSLASFWQSSKLQALHLCFKCKIKETVYSSAGCRDDDLPHCLEAWMFWQLALVLIVPLLPTNECRQEFKGHIQKLRHSSGVYFLRYAILLTQTSPKSLKTLMGTGKEITSKRYVFIKGTISASNLINCTDKNRKHSFSF